MEVAPGGRNAQMTEVINLNKARKAKKKQRQSEQAIQNRVVYGISTKIRKAGADQQKRETVKLDLKVLKSGDDNKKG